MAQSWACLPPGRVLRHRPRETWTLPSPCSRGRGCCSPGIGKLISSRATCGHSRSVWASPSPGSPGLPAAPLAAGVCNLPLGAGLSFWSSRAGFWGLKPGEDGRFTGGAQVGGVPECGLPGRSVGGHRFAALLRVGLVARVRSCPPQGKARTY